MLCSSNSSWDSGMGFVNSICWLDRRLQLLGPLAVHHTPRIPHRDRCSAGVTADDLYWRLPRDGHCAREMPGVVSLRMTNDALGPVRHAGAPLPRPNGGPVQLDSEVKSVLISWPEATTGRVHASASRGIAAAPPVRAHERVRRCAVGPRT